MFTPEISQNVWSWKCCLKSWNPIGPHVSEPCLHPLCRSVQTVLSEGGVPQRPVVFVSRPELVNHVREKLYRLQKEPGWITVFGMAGSGKSVLAAEAVRHHGLIEGDRRCLLSAPCLSFETMQ